jgi:hypothetical protein
MKLPYLASQLGPLNPSSLAGIVNNEPGRYASLDVLKGAKPLHEMSCLMSQTLQYGVTRAQESGPVNSHMICEETSKIGFFCDPCSFDTL